MHVQPRTTVVIHSNEERTSAPALVGATLLQRASSDLGGHMTPVTKQLNCSAAGRNTFPRCLSVAAAAALLRTSESVVKRDLASGRLPALDTPNGPAVDGRRLNSWMRDPYDPNETQS